MFIQANSQLIPLADESIQCIVTSPPYFGLRDYGIGKDGIGLEETLDEYIFKLLEVFRECKRVLRKDGLLWLNIGDTYAGSWGAQSRTGDEPELMRSGKSISWGRQISSAPKGTNIGSLRKTPGLKSKDLIGVPWRIALALQADGWYLRQDIIWAKPNPMPESVKDRCTKSHEYIFILAKSERYFYDHKAILEPVVTAEKENYPGRVKILGRGSQEAAAARGNDRDKSGGYPPSYRGSRFDKGKTAVHQNNRSQPGGRDEIAARNKRSVWTIPTQSYQEAHFATFPEELVVPCVLAGSRIGDRVLDPFSGSGTTVKVAKELGRRGIGIELKWDYLKLAQRRTSQACLSYATS